MFGKEQISKASSQITFLAENYSCLLLDGEALEMAKLLETQGYARNYKIGVVLGTGDALDLGENSPGIKGTTAAELLLEMLADPLLMNYSCLILEINSMEMNLSILLSLLKKIIKKRKEFRIILVYKNANQIDEIIKYFQPSVQAMQLNSKRFQVQEFFLEKPTSDYISEAVETVLKIHDEEGPGGIILSI